MFYEVIFYSLRKSIRSQLSCCKIDSTSKKPHTIGETSLKPACLEIVRLMLGSKEVKEVNKVPLSADTIKKRIDDMSNDMLETLIKKLKTSPKFSIQIDETTDINKKAQLLSVVRFVDGNSISEEYLFCKELPENYW